MSSPSPTPQTPTDLEGGRRTLRPLISAEQFLRSNLGAAEFRAKIDLSPILWLALNDSVEDHLRAAQCPANPRKPFAKSPRTKRFGNDI